MKAPLMKAHLMYKDKDFDLSQPARFDEEDLSADLQLTPIFEAVRQRDSLVLEAFRAAFFTSLQKPEEITYRQKILQDCIRNPDVVRKLYALTNETINRQQKERLWFTTQFLANLFTNSVSMLQMLVEMLRQLREITETHFSGFTSEGFTNLFTILRDELDDDYFSLISEHLSELKFRDGTLISARLGHYNQGINYVLRRKKKHHFWRRWAFAPSFTLNLMDNNGGVDFTKRSHRALNEAANALAQSADHVLGFFKMLRSELAFYIGCLNLYEKLQKENQPLCWPLPVEPPNRRRSFQGLYDISLALTIEGDVTGNSLTAGEQSLYLITGANQGGKSTFLRSVGQAQLMMQCGMYVPAQHMESHLCFSIFSHFRREEDKKMISGKLDEEMERMSRIVDHIRQGSLILLNESFAATNEREGSEISRQIVTALTDSGVEAFCVTHLYEFANDLYQQKRPDITFLRAQRLSDGRRTFQILPGEPLKTSYGEDLYHKIFGGELTHVQR